MPKEYDINKVAAAVKTLRKDAEELKKLAGVIPTVEKNADRILANVRMLEIEVNDAADILKK